MTTTTEVSYSTAPNQVIHADNGIAYAYLEIGTGTVPLVLLQHFRGNLENWEPQLVDALASQHHVIAFDNVGAGPRPEQLPTRSSRWRAMPLPSSLR
jgi:pimeloyl-ACP methyl ester carboxylesterase